MKNILLHLSTINGVHDIGKYSWLWSMLLVSSVVIYKIISKGDVGLNETAQAVGTVAAAHAAALFMKKDQ